MRPTYSQMGAASLLLLIPLPLLSAQKAGKRHPAPIERPSALQPLTPRERVEQLLDRFTYGPRPGEIDRVLAVGADQWFQQQLDPSSVPDPTLNRRLGDLPTVSLSPAQALAVFPDRGQVAPVAEGKAPLPADPLQRAVMEVQVSKWNAELDRKHADGTKAPAPAPTDAEKAAQRLTDQATASRIAGQLLAMPKEQRMTALIAMPVGDRIAFTGNGNLPGPQRNALLADFTPRQREAFLAMSGQVSSSGNLANELAQAHMLRDILSERQLEAVMTDLWFNHFDVFIGKDSDQWYTASYERDVIRPHALGKFRDLLLTTATSPAMMVYLDNLQSIGPGSLANGVNPANPKAKRGNRGLNENYGREVMELHTVGVNGGYTQADVTALAAILTGWGVDKPGEGGGFAFDPRRHEPGAKALLGYCIAENGSVSTLPRDAHSCETDNAPATQTSMQQGVAALKLLAASPQCARFISTMLARYFVADTPPPALVAHLTQTYLASDGDIKALLRTIVNSPEFNSRQYFHNKVKTPVEFLASVFRTTATDPQNPGALVNQAKIMGMPLYYALPPTGYYLTADRWMNSTALVDRLNFAYQLTGGKLPNQRFDAPKLLAMGLMGLTNSGTLSLSAPLPVAERNARAIDATLRVASISAPAPDTAFGGHAAPGSELATRILEQAVTGSAVSAKTHALIEAQIAQQPAATIASDTLNLVTGLLLGSPEFQLR